MNTDEMNTAEYVAYLNNAPHLGGHARYFVVNGQIWDSARDVTLTR